MLHRISIIMPVYNTVKYLETAIRSIIEQTYSDWELICIDDGSTDGSLEILRKFADTNPKIKVITQKNQGAGAARNKGLESAEGEFIIFLDSDDFFSRNLLERLYNNAIEGKADIVICGYSKICDNSLEIVPKDREIPDRIFDISELGNDGFFMCGLAVWNKLIKRNLLDENGIRFQNLSSSNDVFFVCVTICKAKRILYISDTDLITYRVQREGQISQNRNPMNFLCAIKTVIDAISNSELMNKLIQLLIKGSLYEMRNSSTDEKRLDFYKQLTEYIKSNDILLESADCEQKKLLGLFLRNTEDSKWWTEDKLCNIQFEERSKNLIFQMEHYNNRVLWGCGKRGSAFLQFCKKHNISILGVTDQNMKKAAMIVEEYPNTMKLMTGNEAIKAADIIIAGNRNVSAYLQGMEEKVEIMNLEDFCPLM